MQASEVDNHIKWQIQALKGASRDNIWKRFQEGFKGYTVDTFNYGIPVDTQGEVSLAQALYKLA